MNIEGSLALVTGANRGLRAAFCRSLLERGAAKVCAAARAADTIRASGVVAVRLDIMSTADIAAVVTARDHPTTLPRSRERVSGRGVRGPRFRPPSPEQPRPRSPDLGHRPHGHEEARRWQGVQGWRP